MVDLTAFKEYLTDFTRFIHFFWIHGQYISNFSMKLFVIQLGFAGKCEEDNWVNSSRFL